MLIKKYHRISGIVISLFLLLHLSNHLFALGGPSTHIAVMNVLRYIYRFPPVEIFLLACVVFQIASGIMLVGKKIFRHQPFYIILQVLSGLYLSFFMIYHVWAVLSGRFHGTDTNFYYAAWVAAHYPDNLFFIPYYTLSLIAVFVHIACVHYTQRSIKCIRLENAEARAIFERNAKKEVGIICIAGAIVTLLIMISFSGVLYPI